MLYEQKGPQILLYPHAISISKLSCLEIKHISLKADNHAKKGKKKQK